MNYEKLEEVGKFLNNENSCTCHESESDENHGDENHGQVTRIELCPKLLLIETALKKDNHQVIKMLISWELSATEEYLEEHKNKTRKQLSIYFEWSNHFSNVIKLFTKYASSKMLHYFCGTCGGQDTQHWSVTDKMLTGIFQNDRLDVLKLARDYSNNSGSVDASRLMKWFYQCISSTQCYKRWGDRNGWFKSACRKMGKHGAYKIFDWIKENTEGLYSSNPMHPVGETWFLSALLERHDDLDEDKFVQEVKKYHQERTDTGVRFDIEELCKPTFRSLELFLYFQEYYPEMSTDKKLRNLIIAHQLSLPIVSWILDNWIDVSPKQFLIVSEQGQEKKVEEEVCYFGRSETEEDPDVLSYLINRCKNEDEIIICRRTISGIIGANKPATEKEEDAEKKEIRRQDEELNNILHLLFAHGCNLEKLLLNSNDYANDYINNFVDQSIKKAKITYQKYQEILQLFISQLPLANLILKF